MRRKKIKRISSPYQAGTRAHGTLRPLRLRLGAPAAVAQHDEEIIVGAELARRGHFAERLVEGDAVHVDAPVLARAGAVRQPVLIDQAAYEIDRAKFRQQRGIKRDLV